jgi:AcrR family transcriptional regulator
MTRTLVSRKGVPKGDKRQRTRATLVEAAAAVIAERGFDRTSIEAVCARASLSRGSFYGNFKSREDLFLAVMDSQWTPIEADFRPGAPLRTQLRILGEAVAAASRARAPMAAGAAAFQLYILTHPHMRERMTERNAETYRAMAAGFLKIAPNGSLPMPADRFARVIDALITGLVFTRFQTPDLISDEDIVAAFEALAGADAPAPSPWPPGRPMTPGPNFPPRSI